jgi:hypothetical protein
MLNWVAALHNPAEPWTPCGSDDTCNHKPVPNWVTGSVERTARKLILASHARVDAASVTYGGFELFLHEAGSRQWPAGACQSCGPNHIGTLLVLVPSGDARGALPGSGPAARHPRTVFLPLGVRHAAMRMTRGWCFVVKAAVFGART